VICVHLFDCSGGKGPMDEGGVDASFFEHGGGCLAGEYASFAGAALGALPCISQEGLCSWIERLECGDDFGSVQTNCVFAHGIER
jgi:hypothetical protein